MVRRNILATPFFCPFFTPFGVADEDAETPGDRLAALFEDDTPFVCVLFRFFELELAKKASGIVDWGEQILESPSQDVDSFVAPPRTNGYERIVLHLRGTSPYMGQPTCSK
jgi:hypothetical protein